MLLLRSVQLGTVVFVIEVVAGEGEVLGCGLEKMGPAPGRANRWRGKWHSRRRRRGMRVLCMLILGRVVMAQRRGECQFRHWESCSSWLDY